MLLIFILFVFTVARTRGQRYTHSSKHHTKTHNTTHHNTTQHAKCTTRHTIHSTKDPQHQTQSPQHNTIKIHNKRSLNTTHKPITPHTKSKHNTESTTQYKDPQQNTQKLRT